MNNNKVNDVAACAHCTVKRLTEEINGKVFGDHWRCADCGHPFYSLGEMFPPSNIQIMEPVRTLRDEFAMAAMQGLFSASYDEFWVEVKPDIKTTQQAYKWADAMLEVRK